VSRPSLEVADIFRGHGPAWRRANAGHVSLGQLKVMSAIESCRTAALGEHIYEQAKATAMKAWATALRLGEPPLGNLSLAEQK
jgi:hypothetical protein